MKKEKIICGSIQTTTSHTDRLMHTAGNNPAAFIYYPYDLDDTNTKRKNAAEQLKFRRRVIKSTLRLPAVATFKPLCNSGSYIACKQVTLPRLPAIARRVNNQIISNTDQHLKIDPATKSEIEQLKKDTAAAVRTMNEKTAEQKTLESRFTAEVKRCTLSRESEKYATAFKAAFKSVVVAEYKDSLKNRKSKIRVLGKKLNAVKTNIESLEKTIKALNAVQNQLKNDNPNIELIERKLSDHDISLEIVTPETVAALQSYYKDKLHRCKSEYEYTVQSIHELKDIKTLYRRILNGDEITIQITTRFLVNNVSFFVPVGYICNNDNSTYAIRRMYELAAAALKSMGIDDYYISVNYNVFNSSDTLLPLARQITKRQSFNMIQRQGSKTQYSIYYACMRNDFKDHDTADLYSVCYNTLVLALSVKNPAAVAVNVKILERLNNSIQHLNPVIDCDRIEKTAAAANKAVKKYHGIMNAAADYNKNKRMITMLKNIYAAAVNHDTTALKAACYNAMNDYLTSIRAIRDLDRITLNIDDYIDRLISAIDIDNLTEVKKHALQLAYNETKKHLTKSTLKTFSYMLKGYTPVQIAEKRKIDKSTISKHINDIRAAFCTAYTSLVNSGKIDNSTNIILFDPSIFAAVKTVSEKQKKVIDTYNKNSELAKIAAAVNADVTAAACMKYEFKKYVSEFKEDKLQILSLLLNGKSIRETAAAVGVNMNLVKRFKAKVTDTFYSIIELNTDISIDRNALVKVNFNQLVSILID